MWAFQLRARYPWLTSTQGPYFLSNYENETRTLVRFPVISTHVENAYASICKASKEFNTRLSKGYEI